MLEDIYQEASDSGLDMGYLDNYFPRDLVDRDGLLEYLKANNPDQRTQIDKALAKANEDIKEAEGRWLTPNEEAEVINRVLQGNNKTSGKPDSAKERIISILDPAMNQFYANPIESLTKYIRTMTDEIEMRKFFGKGEKTGDVIADYVADLSGSIESTPVLDEDGNPVLDEDGNPKITESFVDGVLTKEEGDRLIEILNARFTNKGIHPTNRQIKNLTYLLTMGSPISAITQLGDLVWSLDQNGAWGTIGAFFGKKEIKLTDIGITEISEEFGLDGGEWDQKALKAVFKYVGLEKMDLIGKETLMNATLENYRRLAREGAKKLDILGKDKLALERMEQYFDGDVDDLINDLKGDEVTDNIRVLIFNILADHQPISMSEMPSNYAKHPNGRVLWQLRSFTLKQIDVFRNKHLDMIKDGDAKSKAQGSAQLMKLAVLFVALNGSVDGLKDWLLGRDVDPEEIVVDNLLKLVGMSRYNTYQFKRHGPAEGMLKWLTPPQVGIGTNISRDIKDVYNEFIAPESEEEMEKRLMYEVGVGDEPDVPFKAKDLRSIKYIPGVGKFFYWHGGGGYKMMSEQNRKEFEKTLKNSPEEITNESMEDYMMWLDDAFDKNIINESQYEKKLNKLIGN